MLSAHLDHLGIGEPINGDKIYNGAMDNASGSAMLLDLADPLHARKSSLNARCCSLFVTAEEKGPAGIALLRRQSHRAEVFHRRRPEHRHVSADHPAEDFHRAGPRRVGPRRRRARGCAALGVEVQPDPEPLRNVFIRSDQYSFIRQGVPSLAMSVGFVKGSPEAAIQKQWLTERYHAPSDDINQPVDLAAAGKYEDVMAALAMKVADAPQPRNGRATASSVASWWRR